MRIYISARYGRRLEMRRVAAKLRKMGHEVTSTWVDSTAKDGAELSDIGATAIAINEMNELAGSSALVLFTERFPKRLPDSGGHDVELGAAIGSRKLIYRVGPRENLFHKHPVVRCVPSKAALYRLLSKS